MRNTKKTSSRPVQVTAPLYVPPTKQATPTKKLTTAQRNARIKQLEEQQAEASTALQASKQAKKEAFEKSRFIAALPKEATVYSHSGTALICIESNTAYDLYNQLCRMFNPVVSNLKDETKTILEMLQLSVENAENKSWAGEFVRVSKEWISTLEILHSIHQKTIQLNK